MRQRKRAQGERSETLTKELPEAIGGDGDDGESKGFYACYLLVSLSPRHKGHTYIGFTVNPRRRIRQHNGEIGCGAWRTKKRRPWEMVLCIHGFPSNVSALQFEWAWQHPNESLAVRKAAASFKSLSGTANKIKLAYTMLTLPSWRSLNITVNYFSTKYTKHSAGCPSLPPHMKVKICPMDELPCYVKGDESLFENDDGWDNKEEGDEVCSGSKTAKETLSNSMFGRAEEQDRNEIGDEMADGLYGWIREGEDCREQFTFAELPAKGDESLFENDDGWDNKEEGDEVCSGIKTAKETLSNSMFGRAEEQDSNEIGDKMADGLYGWIREGEDCREQFTFVELPARPCSNVSTNGSVVGEYADYTGISGLIKDGSFDSRRPAKEPSKFLVTIDDDQTPSSQNVPSEVVVIDVTTPSPLCQNSLWRNKSYERVRKKEGHIVPSEAEVIDLTTPSPLSRSSLWSNLINYA